MEMELARRSQRMAWMGILVLSGVLGALQVRAEAESLLLCDGETPLALTYGSMDATQPYRGFGCLLGAPDRNHAVEISLQGSPTWRADISSYQEVWFFAKCSPAGKKYRFCLYGWPEHSNSVLIDSYAAGGSLVPDEYRLVRIPLADLKTPTFTLNKIENIFLYQDTPSDGSAIRIDDVWVVKEVTPELANAPIIGKLTGIDFSDVPVKTTKEVQIDVPNIGPSPLQITNIDVVGPDPLNPKGSWFAVKPGQTPCVAQPGTSQRFTVSFTPLTPLEAVSDVVLTHNPTVEGTTTRIPLKGMGAAPTLIVSTQHIQFGEVPKGKSTSWTVKVANMGNRDLQIQNIKCVPVQGPFTVTPSSLAVPQGAPDASIVVTYTPQSETEDFTGAKAAQLTLSGTNDPNAATVLIALEGKALSAGAPVGLPVLTQTVTSGNVSLTWPQIRTGEQAIGDKFRVLFAPEPSDLAQGPDGLWQEVPPSQISAGSCEIQNLAPAVDVFVRVEVRTGTSLIGAGDLHIRTTGGPIADLDSPVQEVHAFAPDILMVVIRNKDVQSYCTDTGSLLNYTGQDYEAGPWTITRNNGHPIATGAIHRNSYPVSQPVYEVGYNAPGNRTDLLTVDHEIFVELNEPIGSREILKVTGPLGCSFTLPFSDKYLETPAIQVNQVGYSPSATERYAYVSGWMGKGDQGDLSVALSRFKDPQGTPLKAAVLRVPANELDGRAVCPTAQNIAIVPRPTPDEDSGTEVGSIDLSGAPPEESTIYRVWVPKVGVSWPTRVSHTAMFKAFYTVARGTYFNRWGRELRPECTEWVRPPDHRIVFTAEKANSGYANYDGEDSTFFDQNTPQVDPRVVQGCHHDAGDWDIQMPHYTGAMSLMSLYELNPKAFLDKQLRLPDNYVNPATGEPSEWNYDNRDAEEPGNGIPDVLDEAMWNLKGWMALQEADGGVRQGVESWRHPGGYMYADLDPLPYWTYAREPRHSARIAGVFARMASLLDRYVPGHDALVQDLRRRAKAAYDYAIGNQVGLETGGTIMFAYSEMYRTTQDSVEAQGYEALLEAAFEQRVKWPHTIDGLQAALPANYTSVINEPLSCEFIMGYLQRVPRNPEKWYLDAAISRLTDIAETEYRVIHDNHAHRNGRIPGQGPGWGMGLTMDQYLYAVFDRLELDRTGVAPLSPADRQRYINTVSLCADYVLGCNPLGLTWITCLGSRYPTETLHIDGMAFVKEGKGLMPGLTVLGPTTGISGKDYYKYGTNTMSPGFLDRPLMRRYLSMRGSPLHTEGTFLINIAHSLVFGALLPDGMIPPKSWRPTQPEHRNPFPPLDPVPFDNSNQTDTTQPAQGIVQGPLRTSTAIELRYSGFIDLESGLREVRLWFKRAATEGDRSGAWQDSGKTSSASAGAFRFDPKVQSPAQPDGYYYFYIQATDNAGNALPAPTDDLVFGAGSP